MHSVRPRAASLAGVPSTTSSDCGGARGASASLHGGPPRARDGTARGRALARPLPLASPRDRRFAEAQRS
eukprot:7162730-Alexandrium_andersonii.AAC.1